MDGGDGFVGTTLRGCPSSGQARRPVPTVNNSMIGIPSLLGGIFSTAPPRGVAFDLCRGRIHATRLFRRHGPHRRPRGIRTPRVPAGEGRIYVGHICPTYTPPCAVFPGNPVCVSRNRNDKMGRPKGQVANCPYPNAIARSSVLFHQPRPPSLVEESEI